MKGFAVALIMLLPSCDSVSVEAPHNGDYRIVQNSDGSYSVQQYWDAPGWHNYNACEKNPVGNSDTLENVKILKYLLENPCTPDKD